MSSLPGPAVLDDGGDIASVARLTAGALDATVVVALPALDLTVCAPDPDDRRLPAVRRHVEDRSSPTPIELAAEAPIRRDGEQIGAVVLLGGRRRVSADAEQVLGLAALAVLSAVAGDDGNRSPSAAAARLFADLRGEPAPSGERVVARAGELGSDLRYGAVALVAAPRGGGGGRRGAPGGGGRRGRRARGAGRSPRAAARAGSMAGFPCPGASW